MKIAQELDRLKQIHNLYSSFLERCCDRHLDNNQTDELNKRRKEHKDWVQLLVIRKLYARRLEALYDYGLFLRRSIDRSRKKQGNEELSKEEYSSSGALVKAIRKIRIDNGYWLLNACELLQSSKIRLNELELKTALTIPKEDWDKYIEPQEQKDIASIVMVAKIGDSALTNQTLQAIIHKMMNETKVISRVHYKAMTTFPKLSD